MVSGEECYRAMTELEQRRWVRNVIKHSQDRGLYIPSNALLALKYFTFCDLP